MNIIKKGNPNSVICNHCNSTLEYNKFDLRWSHTEQDDYYIVCPVCKEIVWLTGTPRLHQMYHKAYEEREARKERVNKLKEMQ